MDKLTSPVTGPLTRAPTTPTDALQVSAFRPPRPPAGFSFVRTVSGTALRDPSGAYVIVPGVST